MDGFRGRAGPSRSPDALRVCLISQEYPPESAAGGIGTYTQLLARQLAEVGHDVVVLAGSDAPSSTHGEGVTVRRLAPALLGPIPRVVRSRLSRTLEVAAWASSVRRTLSGLSRERPFDVVEAPEFLAQSVALSTRGAAAPVVVKLHTPTYLCDILNGLPSGTSRLDDWLGQRAERRATTAATLVTSPSAALLDAVSERWGLDPSRTRVVPNPLDAERFRPAVATARADDLVLYVGRLERRKGVDVLARAMADVQRARPGARIRFVGQDQPSGTLGGTMAEVLRATIEHAGTLPGAVSFDGQLRREQLPAVYAGAAIAVIPSLYENFPYTCLEAMASGCAVVGSRAGGIPEIIEDGIDGLLVEPGSSDAIAHAVIRLLDDPGLRRRLAERARETVRTRFSSAAVAEATVEVYREAVERRRSTMSR